MATVANPLRIDLGIRIRQMRIAVGLEQADVDRDPVLGWAETKTSKLEAGQRTLTPAEAHRLAELFRLPPDETAKLVQAAAAARKRTPSPQVADFAKLYVTLEQSAIELDIWAEEQIPGPFQSPDFARELLALSEPANPEAILRDRLRRQSILTRPDPPRVRLILSEGALNRTAASAAAEEQLMLLSEVGRLPNVEIRILPYAAGLHPAMDNPFTTLRLAVPEITRTYREGATEAAYIDEDDEVAYYDRLFRRLWQDFAIDSTASETMVSGRIQQLGQR